MFESLLSSLGGAGNGLLALLGGQAQAQPQQPVSASPGFGTRLMAGLQGALNSNSPLGAVGNLLGGLSTGTRTDPAGVQGAAVQAQLRDLITRGQITPTQAQFLAANPKAWEELSKAMINQPITVAPSGDILVTRPFGQIGIPGAVPQSEFGEAVNPDGSKRPIARVKPSLVNPQGGVVDLGQQPQAAPPAAVPRQTLNPNLPNGGRSAPSNDPAFTIPPSQAARANPGLISSQSPQAVKEAEGVGSDLAAQYADIYKKSAAATARLGTLNRLSQLSPNAYEGAGAPALQLVRSFLTTLGLPSGKVPAGEEFTALTNKMVLDANNGSLGTGVSNADVAFIKNMQPDLSQTKEGRMQIIETARQLALRDQQVAKLAADYRRSNGGSLDGFQNFLSDWAEKNPMFKDVRPPANNFNDRFGAISAPRPSTGEVALPGSPGVRILGVR